MMLGDMGADVIKVERPGRGDETRGWGPPFDSRGESAYFLSVNRNKASLAAELSVEPDRALVARLIGEADVVVENFLPGALERIGLDAARMRASTPSLVWCTIGGFGRDSMRPGYDFVVQAEQGWMSITGEPGGEPMKTGVALADVLTGKDAAIAVLAALVARARTGAGAHVRVSLAESATAALINAAQNALVTGGDAARWGNAHPNLVPYQVFAAADRALVIAVGSDAQWRALVATVDVPSLADDRFARNAQRVEARELVAGALAARLRQRTAGEWQDMLARAGVPCGIVRSVREVLAGLDASPLTGLPPSVPGAVRRPPPRLDEHGAAIRSRGWEYFSGD